MFRRLSLPALGLIVALESSVAVGIMPYGAPRVMQRENVDTSRGKSTPSPDEPTPLTTIVTSPGLQERQGVEVADAPDEPPADPGDLNDGFDDFDAEPELFDTRLRLRVATPQGLLLIYDAANPPDDRRTEWAYVAYWSDAASELVWVYHRLVFERSDIGAALVALERDLGIDVAAVSVMDTGLTTALGQADPPTDDSPFWWPATERSILKIMGFDAPRGNPVITIGADGGSVADEVADRRIPFENPDDFPDPDLLTEAPDDWLFAPPSTFQSILDSVPWAVPGRPNPDGPAAELVKSTFQILGLCILVRNDSGCCGSTDPCCLCGSSCCNGGCCWNGSSCCGGVRCCGAGASHCCGGGMCCAGSCCSGYEGGCCPSTFPKCCGSFCCGSAQICGVDECCQAGQIDCGVCCGGSSGSHCCGDHCCPAGQACTQTSCCLPTPPGEPPYVPCSGEDRCCPDGTTCCGTNSCCGGDTPACVGNQRCCGSGEILCNGECCDGECCGGVTCCETSQRGQQGPACCATQCCPEFECSTHCCVNNACAYDPMPTSCTLSQFDDVGGCVGDQVVLGALLCNEGSCGAPFNVSVKQTGGEVTLSNLTMSGGGYLYPQSCTPVWVTAIVAADSQPGTTALTLTATDVGERACGGSGTSCSATAEITVPDNYTTVEVRYRMFIACEIIPLNFFGLPFRYYEGDGRGFQYSGGTHRSWQDFSVTLHPDSQDGQAGIPIGQFGTTRQYAVGQSDVVPCNPPYFICPTYCQNCLAPTAIPSCIETAVDGQNGNLTNVEYERMSSSEVQVVMDLIGNNPCQAADPSFDVHIIFQFRQLCADGQLEPMEWRIVIVPGEGHHDGFPWHELYLNGVEVYRFDPCSGGQTPNPNRLYDPLDVTMPDVLGNWQTVPGQ